MSDTLKRTAAAVTGTPLFVFGAYALLSWQLRILRQGLVVPIDLPVLLSSLLICSCVATVGFSALRFAVLRQSQASGGVVWWRIALGVWLVVSSLRNYFAPAPNLLKPSSPAEASGMAAATVGIAFLGVWFLVSGLRAKFPKP